MAAQNFPKKKTHSAERGNITWRWQKSGRNVQPSAFNGNKANGHGRIVVCIVQWSEEGHQIVPIYTNGFVNTGWKSDFESEPNELASNCFQSRVLFYYFTRPTQANKFKWTTSTRNIRRFAAVCMLNEASNVCNSTITDAYLDGRIGTYTLGSMYPSVGLTAFGWFCFSHTNTHTHT